jgi:predicted DNA-binding transcriptional regulator YafY
MPLIPRGLSQGLIDRVKQRVKQELGLVPSQQGPPNSEAEMKLRIRTAVSANPPRLVRVLYQAEDATTPTWREMECYSLRYRGKGGVPLLYAYCRKDNAIEAFRFDRVKDIQLTNKPFEPKYQIEVGSFA